MNGDSGLDNSDYTAIPVTKLLPFEKWIIGYTLTMWVLTAYTVTYFATFDGIWIAGLPKNIFIHLLHGFWASVLGLTLYIIYSRHFGRRNKETTTNEVM